MNRRLFLDVLAVLASAIPIFIEWMFVPYHAGHGRVWIKGVANLTDATEGFDFDPARA
jgi:hypothetical protein